MRELRAHPLLGRRLILCPPPRNQQIKHMSFNPESKIERRGFEGLMIHSSGLGKEEFFASSKARAMRCYLLMIPYEQSNEAGA